MAKKYLLNLALLFAMPSLFAQPSRLIDPRMGQSAPSPTRDQGESGTLSVGLRISSEADDNALSDDLTRRANVMTVVEPHFKWNVSRPKLDWFLDYANGFSVSRPLQLYSAQSHLFAAAFGLRPGKHLKIVLTNTFQDTKDPFASFPASQSSITGSAVSRSSASIFPGTNRTLERADGELTYGLSRRTSVGAGGSFFAVRYHAADTEQLLPKSLKGGSSSGGRLFYSYHLTRHQLSGFRYEVQKLGFGASSLVDSFFYTHQVLFSRSREVSLYIGQQRSNILDEPDIVLPASKPPRTSAWHWAGGATYTWKTAASAMRIGVGRRIDSSSGLPGATSITSIAADFRRPVTRRWSADIAAAYDRESELSAERTLLLLAWVAGGFSRALGPGMSLDLRYWRLHESTESVVVQTFRAHHNRVSVSLSYDFKILR